MLWDCLLTVSADTCPYSSSRVFVPVPIGQEAGWVPVLVWKSCGKLVLGVVQRCRQYTNMWSLILTRLHCRLIQLRRQKTPVKNPLKHFSNSVFALSKLSYKCSYTNLLSNNLTANSS
jgi:hypothetical protein